MDNTQNLRPGIRRLSQNRGQELFKISDGVLLNEDSSNNQLLQQGKDINFLSVYYNKKTRNGNFMEKISKLNKQFYNFSNKYVKSKKVVEKLNDDLYLNLFDQIDCYVEEIERLNKKISSNNNQELKKTIEQLNKEILEKKEKIRNYENKIKEKMNNEEKLKKEIESYKRSLIFYKDKIKIGILARNRNSINPLGRETSYLNYNKKSSKNAHNNYLSPISHKKKNLSKNKTYKDLNLKLDTEIYDKENIVENEDKENNIIDSGEKIKNINKKFKMKESIYKIDGEYNFLENKKDYDIYGKDIEEKEDEYNNSFELIRRSEKSKTTKTNNEDLNPEEHSQKFSSGFLNALTQELYGSPGNSAKNTTENVSSFSKNNSSEAISEKKESNEIEKDKKSKTFDNKGSGTNFTKKKINKFSINVNKSGNIKSKINNKKNNYKSNQDKNRINSKNENESNYNNKNKIKQSKTSTKSKPKIYNKSTEDVSSFSEVHTHTPYVKNKIKKQFDKDKEKKNPSTCKTQSSIDSTSAYKYKTNILPSNEGRISKKNEVNKRSEDNIEESKYFKMKRKKTDLNPGYNSMSNLNNYRKYNASSKSNINRNNEKENNKELTSVFKDVNDDYLKSIEMLRKQEEQIKYMLRFIDLDDEK